MNRQPSLPRYLLIASFLVVPVLLVRGHASPAAIVQTKDASP
jgi:hypothetical protein